MWELFFQEKIIKPSHISLIPLKTEKENKFLGFYFEIVFY